LPWPMPRSRGATRRRAGRGPRRGPPLRGTRAGRDRAGPVTAAASWGKSRYPTTRPIERPTSSIPETPSRAARSITRERNPAPNRPDDRPDDAHMCFLPRCLPDRKRADAFCPRRSEILLPGSLPFRFRGGAARPETLSAQLTPGSNASGRRVPPRKLQNLATTSGSTATVFHGQSSAEHTSPSLPGSARCTRASLSSRPQSGLDGRSSSPPTRPRGRERGIASTPDHPAHANRSGETQQPVDMVRHEQQQEAGPLALTPVYIRDCRRPGPRDASVTESGFLRSQRILMWKTAPSGAHGGVRWCNR